jgi:ABC-type siderophore export system fused ATPase/permease subunit
VQILLQGVLPAEKFHSETAIARFEQVRFRLARLGKSRSLHEIFERNRHFYYPQRLWIALLLSIVGIVFFCAVYMYFTFQFTQLLISFRIQITNIMAQINSFLGSAPSYLRLMTSTLYEGLEGAIRIYLSCCCSFMQT